MKSDGTDWKGRIAALWANYRFALLVMLAGAVLMLLPGRTNHTETADQTGTPWTEPFPLEEFEHRMEDTLSRIEGAGRTRVLLTLAGGSRQLLAQNQNREGEESGEFTIVTVGKGGGRQEVVPLQILAPKFRGALVVCPGGDQPAVRLKLTQAVTALTGLRADQIAVCSGGEP